MPGSAFDLSKTHVHLGLGSRTVPVPDFEWTPEFLERYTADFASDAEEGRLVMIGASGTSWTFWERHPAGEELVVVLSGEMTLVQDLGGLGGAEHRIPLHPGEAAINPKGIWHTVDVTGPGDVLFITPGIGTEHRPR
jgi:mannose-6-phosphate isomerase-like protein (cupin superfamily)